MGCEESTHSHSAKITTAEPGSSAPEKLAALIKMSTSAVFDEDSSPSFITRNKETENFVFASPSVLMKTCNFFANTTAQTLYFNHQKDENKGRDGLFWVVFCIGQSSLGLDPH